MRCDILVVDGNNIAYREYASKPPLSYGGFPTSAIYGFLLQLAGAIKTCHPKYIIVAWDSRESKRKEIYPAYKANRKKDDPNIKNYYKQVEVLQKEIMSAISGRTIQSISFNGYEADDIIASVVETNNESVVILSNDSDLRQLLAYHNVAIYDGKKFHTKKTFIDKYGFEPDMYPAYKAIVGDSSDNIKGVKGMGKVAAKKIINESEYYEDVRKHIVSLKGAEAIDAFDKAMELIYLPLHGEILDVELIPYRMSVDGIVDVSYRYGLTKITPKKFKV